jgi:hypothetical protein
MIIFLLMASVFAEELPAAPPRQTRYPVGLLETRISWDERLLWSRA